MKNDIGKNENNHMHHNGLPEEENVYILVFSKLVWKKAVIYLLPLIIVAVVVGFVFYNNGKEARLKLLLVEQQATVSMSRHLLNEDISESFNDIRRFSGINQTKNLFDVSGNINPQMKDELTEKFLFNLDIYKRYDQLRILDNDGMEVVRVNYQSEGSVAVSDTDLQNKADRDYFAETIKLEPGEIFVSALDLNMENGQIELPIKPIIRIGTPIENAAGQKAGIIVMNYYADIPLEHVRILKADNDNLQLMLLNPQGYWLLGPEADMEWGFMYSERESENFGNYYPTAWKEILNKDEGIFVTPEGSFTFEKVYPLHIEGINFFAGGDEYFWIMVSRIPNDVLSAANLDSLLIILGIGSFITLLIMIITITNIQSKEECMKYNHFITEKNSILEKNKKRLDKLYNELKVNEERLSLAVKGAEDGIWDWDIKIGTMQFSKLYMDMLGYAEDELPSHVNTWIESVHPEDYPFVEKKLQSYFKGSVPDYSVELRLLCKDGSYKWILCRGTIVERDLENQPLRMIGIHSDISTRKVIEIELVEARETAHRANMAKSEFLSNMSHEIRTPINAIVGFTELALKTSLTPQQGNYMNKIKVSSHMLLGIIGDILDISKLEAGKVELEVRPFKLEEMLQSVAAQISAVSQEKGLELLISIAEDVPVCLIGDSLRLGQVLTNLASNAVKFTDEGEVIIKVKLLKNGGSSALLQFSVEDTGIGLSEEQMKNLFQPFNQAETSTTRKYGGTGLGLAISRKLVSLMGGEIWVESKAGKGSTFFVTARFDIAGKERFGSFKNAFEMWNMKVLVVDDFLNSQEIIKSMLTGMSFDVTTCASGEEAIAIIKAAADVEGYDLVVMDWKMPGMDGIEASRRIKRLFTSNEAPVIIMLTAYNSLQMLAEAKQLGVEAVLYKPVTPSLLLNTIMQIFGKEGFEQISMSLEEKPETEYLAQLRGTQVLLVEDNEINQEVAQEILQAAGMTVTIANNGKEAVEMVMSSTYDIVLMDIQMPVMDGYDATREMRKNPAFAELPIIAMTANVLHGEKEKCIQAGMNAYTAKPIDTTQLFQTMGYWIKEKQRSSPDKDSLGEIKQSPATNKSSAINDNVMPELDGIDVQSALSRLSGNQKLYQKLLVKFYKNHQNDIKEIQQALDLGDLKTAERMAHTIKGAAGNIGAQEVYIAAGALEVDALSTFRLENVEPLMGQLEKALELVFASIAFWEEKGEETPSSDHDGANAVPLIPVLAELAKLLIDNDMAAGEYLEEIVTQAKNTAFSDKAAQIKDLVDQYDFEGALEILNETLSAIRRL